MPNVKKYLLQFKAGSGPSSSGWITRDVYNTKAEADAVLRSKHNTRGVASYRVKATLIPIAAKNPRGGVQVIRNTEGFMSGGKFHPIRSGDDYEPDEVGEEYAYAPAKKKKKVGAKKNPSASFPVGKFVKVDSIRVNKTGTIDVMRSKAPKRAARRPKR